MLDNGFLPWAFLKGEEIVITNAVLKVLDGLAVDSLKSLAERFGWVYSKVRIRGKTPWAIKVPLSDFVAFLESRSDEAENSDSEPEYQEWDLSEVL